MSTFAISSNIVNSNALNVNSDISCKNGNGSGGRAWTGAEITRTGNGTPKIGYAKCGSISIEEDIYNLKKGTLLDNTCDCEMIVEKQGELLCPPGKFLNTYYPLLKKASCCTTCTDDGKAKTSFGYDKCSFTFKTKNDTDLSCPPNKFLNSLSINQNNAKLNCCSPTLKGENIEKHVVNNEECKKVGIDQNLCNDDNLKDLKHKCKEYGIANCTQEEILKVEEKCNVYGMRYFDSANNKYKNTDSYLNCHVDNFDKLDNYCKENSMGTCNFYNMRQTPSSDINSIKNDIENIDKIQSIYEKKISNFENINAGKMFKNKIFVIIMSIICTLIVIALIYFILKQKQ